MIKVFEFGTDNYLDESCYVKCNIKSERIESTEDEIVKYFILYENYSLSEDVKIGDFSFPVNGVYTTFHDLECGIFEAEIDGVRYYMYVTSKIYDYLLQRLNTINDEYQTLFFSVV